MNQHTLFTTTEACYTNLVQELATAEHEIALSYFSFEDGYWANAIAQALRERVRAGVRARLLVDQFGQWTDAPNQMPHNYAIIDRLRAYGVHVDVFQPAHPFHILNRLHTKFAAIDARTVFLGGSNVGDYYTTWVDTNLRVDGELGDTFHAVYDLLAGYSKLAGRKSLGDDAHSLRVGNERLRLTIPNQHHGIRQGLMELIHRAESAIYIRAWYFLPEDEELDALCEAARRGVNVNVLLSHKTRVRPVDFANYLHVHKLVCAGGQVYRYTGKYMHGKAVWNDRGDILLGSANFNATSMRINFETCLEINDLALAWELRRLFQADCAVSVRQTPDSHLSRSFADQALSHACNVASPWL